VVHGAASAAAEWRRRSSGSAVQEACCALQGCLLYLLWIGSVPTIYTCSLLRVRSCL
jgi:hypothetical protein